MLLAYVHCDGAEGGGPQLCIVPDKPDQFSIAAKVDMLGETTSAIYRVGPVESLITYRDPDDGGIIIKPIRPAKLFLTLNLSDSPGNSVDKVKILKGADGNFQSFFHQERFKEGDWHVWEPLKKI